MFFTTNWLIVFPQVIVRLYRKIRECCHKKTQEEIERELKIKSIIKLPSARSELDIQNRYTSKRAVTLNRNKDIEKECKDVVIERIKGPNYHQHVEFMRRMEEFKKRRQEFQRANRPQPSEWAKF